MQFTSYCEAVGAMPPDSLHRVYHDTAYGFPLYDDNELFGRLLLEINQAGLSWTTILQKQENFRAAYAGFDIAAVAEFTEQDRLSLLNNAGIIRNRLKINAAIENANRILQLQKTYGSFKDWLDAHHPLSKEEWTKLFKKTFLFTGGEIVNEFLMSLGYLPNAHIATCPVYQQILALNPPFLNGDKPHG
jgi:DNA-3-methyladenine glycosylase I